METKTVYVPDIHCHHCVNAIKNELESMDGVMGVTGSTEAKMITVSWDSPASWEKIAETLREIGYPADEK